MNIFIVNNKFHKHFLDSFIKANNVIFLESDLEIIKYVEKKFDPSNKIIIFSSDCSFLFMYLTKIAHSIVALVSDEHSAHMTAEHNKASILLIPMLLISSEMAISISQKFLNAHFEDPRHNSRLDMLIKEIDPDAKI